MSRQKQSGTQAETQVVKWLQAHGWADAERLALSGATDKGDVKWVKGVIIEVKHRRTTTSNAGLGQPGHLELAGWMGELEAERKNANADRAWLIVKRSGTTDVGQWWAYTPMHQLAGLWGVALDVDVAHAPVCMTVSSAAALMEGAGYERSPSSDS